MDRGFEIAGVRGKARELQHINIVPAWMLFAETLDWCVVAESGWLVLNAETR